MTKFGFVLHPLSVYDIKKRKWWAKFLPDGLIETVAKATRPYVASHITGIRSKTGKETEGWFAIVPMTPKQMLADEDYAVKQIIRAGELLALQGASIMGLGAFTSVVKDAGITVAEALDSIGVTTGNSYTAYTAGEALLLGAKEVGIDLKNATLSVVGATGSIGNVLSKLLAPQVGRTLLVARNVEKLAQMAESLAEYNVSYTTNVPEGVREADLLVTVSSAPEAIVKAEDLKPGTVVVDVSRPRNVAAEVGKKRSDVLVLDGGVVRVPGDDVEFNFNFGFPPKTAFACMSETMMLALEDWRGDFSLGRDLKEEQVLMTGEWARKHGFEVVWMRSFDLPVTEEQIDRVRRAREVT
ncbi:shikimate dehydrogenase [Coprothermobacteraceae bacterium]|nr:shikimate dehydrogenase [Coprothermobacteraceae bacterium]